MSNHEEKVEHGGDGWYWDNLGGGWRLACMCGYVTAPDIALSVCSEEMDEHLNSAEAQPDQPKQQELPLIEPTEKDEREAQATIAKEYGYEAGNDGLQKLAESCSDWNRATDVLMDLASTEASLTAHRRFALYTLIELNKRDRELEAAKASNQRLTDLVRQQRMELLQEGLIAQEEYAALAADTDNGQRVARLEGYDTAIAAAKERIAELEAALQAAVDAANKLPSATGLSPVQNFYGLPAAIHDLQDSYRDAARSRNGMHTKMQQRAEAAEAKLTAVEGIVANGGEALDMFARIREVIK